MPDTRETLQRPSRLLLAALLALLCGCADDPAQALWQDYLARLERLTDNQAPPPAEIPRHRYPDHSQLQQPLPDIRSGLWRFMELRQCGNLMALVSERNSSLGKLQAPSLRLSYELRFLEQARQCLDSDTLAGQPELRQWLQGVVEEKQQALMPLMWNLGFAGRELAGYFSLAVAAPAPDSGDSLLAARHALDHLAGLAGAMKRPQPPADTGSLEADLQRLDNSRAGGRVLEGLRMARRQLPRATALLNSLEGARLCPKGRVSRQAQRLNNVFTEIYGKRVQPWLSDVSQAADSHATRLWRLREAFTINSPALDAWLEAGFSEQGHTGGLQDALQAHVDAWQQALKPCGLAPGQ
jgi:hypothetical protein